MDWSKAKNLILGMLVLLNLILLFMLGYSRYVRRQGLEDAVQQAVTVLENAGVGIDASLIPRETGNRQQLLIQRDVAGESAFATAILPDGVFSDDSGLNRYESASGSLEWRIGGLLEGSLPGTDARKLLENAGIAGIWETDGDALSVTQTLDKLPVFNCVLSAREDADGITISGRWCFGAAQAIDDSTELALPGLLLNFLREAETLPAEITSLEPGYQALLVAGVGVRLLPVWRIGAGDAFWMLSALDGELLIPD